MQKTVYNPQKGRLETIDISYKSADVSKITGFEGGIVIFDSGYSYPVWVYDVSRSDINHDRQKAFKLLQLYTR